MQPFYGSLRPFRQLPAHYPARTIPAATAAGIPPLSPLERLRALGLIFHHRPTQEIFIPTDLIEPISEWLKQHSSEWSPDDQRANERMSESVNQRMVHDESPSDIRYSPFDLLCHDLTCLLALLQTADVRPWHGQVCGDFFFNTF